ncbi:MAG: hypothetical protein JWN96_2242 [Mycobacterium sp.]|nr:hypothetical protein [Mycobacterium sp.]
MGRILFRGGRIYAPVPEASAILVDDGHIAWVGSDAAAAGLGEPDTVVELDGAWLAPAFVDAHVHVVAAGLARSTLDLTGSRSRAEVLERLAAAAVNTRGDTLIWGTGWDETMWSDPLPPTADELDRASGGRAVYLSRTDMHSAIANPVLLQAAGLPEAGGPVVGDAHHALRRAARGRLTDDQRRDAAEAFFAEASRNGIGMVHECAGPDIGGADEPGVIRQAADQAGIDLVTYWGEPGKAGLQRAALLNAQPGGDIFIDGSLGSRTAALSVAYTDAEGTGSRLLEPDAITEHLILATRAGMQAGFHAIGDAAISALVAGLERAAVVVGARALAGSRHRVEHLEMAGVAHLEALARYGIVASVQPGFDATWGGDSGMYAARLGRERARAMNNFAALAAAGIPLAFGSDAPATALDPWAAVRAAAHPTVTDHALSARAAFLAHTRGGQRAARCDNAGVLREGAEATFAIWQNTGELLVAVPDDRVSAWSTDPRSGAPGLPDLSVGTNPTCVATIVRGRPIHDSGMVTR